MNFHVAARFYKNWFFPFSKFWLLKIFNPSTYHALALVYVKRLVYVLCGIIEYFYLCTDWSDVFMLSYETTAVPELAASRFVLTVFLFYIRTLLSLLS